MRIHVYVKIMNKLSSLVLEKLNNRVNDRRLTKSYHKSSPEPLYNADQIPFCMYNNMIAHIPVTHEDRCTSSYLFTVNIHPRVFSEHYSSFI